MNQNTNFKNINTQKAIYRMKKIRKFTTQLKKDIQKIQTAESFLLPKIHIAAIQITENTKLSKHKIQKHKIQTIQL